MKNKVLWWRFFMARFTWSRVITYSVAPVELMMMSTCSNAASRSSNWTAVPLNFSARARHF